MNDKERTCLRNLGILLAEGTSGYEFTLPELAGSKKLIMIIYYYYECYLFLARFPHRCLLHHAYIFCSEGTIIIIGNNKWALGTACFLFRS